MKIIQIVKVSETAAEVLFKANSFRSKIRTDMSGLLFKPNIVAL
jgi:hypothetical protein